MKEENRVMNDRAEEMDPTVPSVEEKKPVGPMVLTHFPPVYPSMSTVKYVLLLAAYLLGLGILVGLNKLYWGAAILCVCILLNYRNLRTRLPFDQIRNPSLRALVSFLFILVFAFVGVLLNATISIGLLILLLPIGNDILSIYYNTKIDRMEGLTQTLAMLLMILVEIFVIFGISLAFM